MKTAAGAIVALSLVIQASVFQASVATLQDDLSTARSLLSTTTTSNIKLSVKNSLNKFNSLDSSVNTLVNGVNTGKVNVGTSNDAQQSGNIGTDNTVSNGGSVVILPLRRLSSTSKTTNNNIKLAVKNSLNKFNSLDSSVNTAVTGVNTGKVTVTTFNDAQQNANIGDGNTVSNGGSVVILPLRRLSSTSKTTNNNIKLAVKNSLNKFNSLDSSANTGVTGVNTGKVTVTTFNDAQQNANIGSGNTVDNSLGAIYRRLLSGFSKVKTSNFRFNVKNSFNQYNKLDSSVNTVVSGVNTGNVAVTTSNVAVQNGNIGNGNTIING